MKFAFHNCTKKEEAEVVLVGVPDETGSYAFRKGASKGPNAIRKASLDRLRFVRKGDIHYVIPERGNFKVKFFDAGDIKKSHLSIFIDSLTEKQFPITLGGDHSSTFFVLRSLQAKYNEIAVIYLDAHPDMVSSMHENYYGSVAFDIANLKHVNKNKIIELGIRSIEAEEIKNLRKNHISSFTALDIYEQGVNKIFAFIKKKVDNTPLYLSIDLDVLDPAFAPGVDTPAPFGLLPNEYLSLIKRCAKLNLIGFDIMEMSPKYDKEGKTSQLAAQTILEILGSRR